MSRYDELEQLSNDILNAASLRDALRREIKAVGRLERLEGVRDFDLRNVDIVRGSPFIDVGYDGIATEDFYPRVKSKLIKAGVVDRRRIVGVNGFHFNEGQPDEYEEVTIQESAGWIRMGLRVYNPGYVRPD